MADGDQSIKTADLCRWYEGFSDGPSTNNGLESNNRVIKNCHTLRRGLLLPAFFRTVEKNDAELQWRFKRQAPVTTADVPSQLFREAFFLEQENRVCFRLNTGYVLPTKSGVEQNIQQIFEELYGENSIWSWNRYKELRSAFYIVEPSNVWVNFYKCTCSVGVKKNPCKHAIMIMKKVGLIRYPAEAISNPLAIPLVQRQLNGYLVLQQRYQNLAKVEQDAFS
uniref:SWIM-type domain-containing protein n=1 Tax=Ditylenchus dipsaci TaxID=166011 RepID=A0A915EAJ0_9BILA